MAIKYLAIIQARCGSTRFPNKVLQKINNKTLIRIIFERLRKSKKIDKIILATTKKTEDDSLAKEINSLGYEVFRGSENNVLKRYFDAAKKYNPHSVVRITGDCPLIDASIVDRIINLYEKSEADYCSNVIPPTFPDGLDAEVFSMSALKFTHKNAIDNFQREHVTPFIIKNDNFKKNNLTYHLDLSNERLTVDEEDDYSVIKNIFKNFYPEINFSFEDVMLLLQSNPDIFQKNKHLKRNEGSVIGKGQKLYKRAKRIIPGGTMLLSKRPEMFLPDLWPSYFSKAKGCYVWDLDGHKYLDMSIMGIGTNILGYAHDEVDDAVHRTIDNSNMSTFNCPEEVYLAEKLIELHPWAEMARFARSGGEANAIAIRIARAASGKDNIAICGYHGWHDWYLSTNLNNQSGLDGHLLPGLDPKGVPKALGNTVFPFNYNDYEALEKYVKKKDIGVIKMEVSRYNKPNPGFLQDVRKLADKNNIILIFDECTSGFRQTYGGLHKLYEVEPDMAMFGKALGNGYAITAVIGKAKIMVEAQSTFISSTFWTERIGPTAALKTLEIMKREKSWEIITDNGMIIKNKWEILAKKYELPIKIGGLPALISFSLDTKYWNYYKTYLTQEMLKNSILASNMIYVCTEHKTDEIDKYFHHLEPIFEKIKTCEKNPNNISQLLDGSPAHQGFKRLI